MKRTALIVLISTWSIGSGAVSISKVDGMEDAALIDRLQSIFKKNHLRFSDTNLNRYLESPVSASQLTQNERQNWIMALLSELKNSEKTIISSKKPIGSVFSKSKISDFCFGNNPCTKQLYHLVTGLEPACFEQRVPSVGGVIDKNPCFAGDGLLLKDAEELKLDPIADPKKFVAQLLVDIGNLPAGAHFNLMDTLQRAGFGRDPKKLFVLMGLIGTSGNSGITGWLQGVEDRMLVSDLNNHDLKAEDVYKKFKVHQRSKLEYRAFRDVLEKKRLQQNINGRSVETWNRHNFMAAFLGCHMGVQSASVTSAVMVGSIGVGYESKDFVSHIKEGYGVKAASQNFMRDSSRYVEASYLGATMCDDYKAGTTKSTQSKRTSH